MQDVRRSNGNGLELDNDIKLNLYIAEHTYPGRAAYTIGMMDKNRIGGILNVNPPSSISIPFYIQTTYNFLNPQFQGYNNSVCLLQPPIDFACVGKKFIHIPNAFDPDLDSIAFKLVVPFQDSGLLVPNYSFPNQISPGADNQISLNPITGEFVWNAPQIAGEYNIAIEVQEYRNGNLINSVIRDMQILVNVCDNDPPLVESISEICVIAGEKLIMDLVVSDPNIDDLVELTAIGGPMIQDSFPALLITQPGYQEQPFLATLEWQTNCNHINPQYYSIVLKARDDFYDTTGLAFLKTVRIKVVGPPPQDVLAVTQNNEVLVNWESPYSCEDAREDFFKGFSVWRKTGSNQFEIDTCTPGLAGKGYERIAFNIKEKIDERYVYLDPDVESGKTYCYRIVAEFAKTTASGQSYNRVPGLPSEEFCIQLNRDIPLITKVSVSQTDNSNGMMEIRWAKPLAEQLDTVANPKPYRFVLLHADGLDGTTFSPVPNGTFTSDEFASFRDTMVVHVPSNTSDLGHNYQVEFFTNDLNKAFGKSLDASSVYLTVQGTDKANELSWDFNTPWDNYKFEVFRQNEIGVFELIATTEDQNYLDKGLINGKTYCYQIQATGSYGITLIEDPLFNLSQEGCGVPSDNIAPCPPEIEVTNICGQVDNTTPEDAFINTVKWDYPPIDGCDEAGDVESFNIYFAKGQSGDFLLVANVLADGTLTFNHQPETGIAGCYYSTAIDTVGNESGPSNIVCVENCPYYELPNVFSPNGDGANDTFKPFPYRFIERVEMKIFNRWGNLVIRNNRS